jgi:hypothetical protein
MTKTTEFKRAVVAGAFRDIAIAKGGTGHLRKELTPAQRAQNKSKRKQVKISRRGNR